MYAIIKQLGRIVRTCEFDFFSDALQHIQDRMQEEIQYELMDIINECTGEVLLTVNNGIVKYVSTEAPFLLLEEMK